MAKRSKYVELEKTEAYFLWRALYFSPVRGFAVKGASHQRVKISYLPWHFKNRS